MRVLLSSNVARRIFTLHRRLSSLEIKDSESFFDSLWPNIALRHGYSIPFHPSQVSEFIRRDGISESSALSTDIFNRVETPAKLGMSYLAKNSPDFITEAARILCRNLEKATSGDLLVLSLLIFSRKNWKNEEILEFFDPVIFQRLLSEYVSRSKYSPSELSIILLVFKRASICMNDFKLRKDLYFLLKYLVSGEKFDVETSACIINAIVVLNRDVSLVERDDKINIWGVLNNANYSSLNIRASVKVMSLGLMRNIIEPKGARINIERLKVEGLKALSLRDLVGLLYYLNASKTEKDCPLYKDILNELSTIKVISAKEALDLLQCHSYLIDAGHLCKDFYKKLVRMVEILPDSFEQDPAIYITQTICKVFQVENSDEVFIKLVHILPYLCFSYRFMDPSLIPNIDEKKLARLCLPSMKELPRTEIFQKNIYKTLLRDVFSTKDFVRFIHVLPYFRYPNIVFGHLGGNALQIPSYMTEQSCLVKPPPEIGEWFVIFCVASQPSIDEHQITNVDQLLKSREVIKKHHLTKLGYKVIVVSSNDVKLYKNRLAEVILRWSFETQ